MTVAGDLIPCRYALDFRQCFAVRNPVSLAEDYPVEKQEGIFRPRQLADRRYGLRVNHDADFGCRRNKRQLLPKDPSVAASGWPLPRVRVWLRGGWRIERHQILPSDQKWSWAIAVSMVDGS